MTKKQKVIEFLVSNGFEYEDDNSFSTNSHFVNLDETENIELMDENGNNFIVFENFKSFKTYLIEQRIVKGT